MAAAAAEQLRVAAEKGDCDKLRELLAGGGASVVNERAVFVDGAGEKSWTTALIDRLEDPLEEPLIEVVIRARGNRRGQSKQIFKIARSGG